MLGSSGIDGTIPKQLHTSLICYAVSVKNDNTMRGFFIVFSIFWIAANSFGQTQHELNEAQYKLYETADKELNAAYQKILKEYKEDTVFIMNLKKAQKLWIQFRDAEMKMKYPDREPGYYGSIQPLCWSIYLTELTKSRTQTLKIWIDGVEEGDACCGSVRTKE
jgi:uncharacterized protein YecT (DUF1311 family)